MKAFPNVTGEKGMDLRDYFAAKAMHAIIGEFLKGGEEDLAKEAYVIADAMMKAREA
jgi:hypothetical protein